MTSRTREVTSPSQGGEVLCHQRGSEVQGHCDGFEELFLDRSSIPYGERIPIAGTGRTSPPLTPLMGHRVPPRVVSRCSYRVIGPFPRVDSVTGARDTAAALGELLSL